MKGAHSYFGWPGDGGGEPLCKWPDRKNDRQHNGRHELWPGHHVAVSIRLKMKGGGLALLAAICRTPFILYVSYRKIITDD